MKKNSIMRKLVFSIISVMVALVSLVTSTYAWFSMNTSVSVTGIQITVESDAVYLLIGTENDIDAVQSAAAITTPLTTTPAEARVLPAAHEDLSDADDAADPENWYYRRGDAPNASTSTKPKTVLSSANFANYVIHKVCYITVAIGSTPATNLVVSEVTITSDGTATGANTTLAPIKIVVATSTAVAELDSEHTSSDVVLAANIDDTTLIAVDIYLYYDGNHESVYTNNMINLDGASIDIEFSVD